MKRWVWNSFCLFSLLVFVGSVALWVRSCLFGDTLIRYSRSIKSEAQPNWVRGDALGVGSGCGTICFFHYGGGYAKSAWTAPYWEYNVDDKPWNSVEAPHAGDYINLRLGGFQILYAIRDLERDGRVLNVEHPHELTEHRLVLPLWLFLPAALPPWLWWRKRCKGRGRGFPVMVSAATGPELNHQDTKATKTATKS